VCSQGETELAAFWDRCDLPGSSRQAAMRAYRHFWDLIQARRAEDRLMGRVDEDEFYLKHLADSLAVLLAWPELFAGPVKLADVGAGAGLPGLVLAIALPEIHLTAIESNHRKARFIRLAARELALADRVEVIDRRSRELAHDPAHRGRYELLTARAVAKTDKLIRDCRRLLAPGGSAVFYKTPAAVVEEMPLAQPEARRHHLELMTSAVIELPCSAGKRQFIRLCAA